MEIPSAWHPAVAIRHRVAGSFHRTTCLRPSTHCPTADASADHAAALRATGTDDATAADDAHCHPKCHQRANESTRSDTNAHGEDKRTDDGATATIDSRKALRLTKDSDEVRARAIQRVNAGGGTRTHTGCDPQRILNPSRLPIPPHRQVSDLFSYPLVRQSNVLCLQGLAPPYRYRHPGLWNPYPSTAPGCSVHPVRPAKRPAFLNRARRRQSPSPVLHPSIVKTGRVASLLHRLRHP